MILVFFIVTLILFFIAVILFARIKVKIESSDFNVLNQNDNSNTCVKIGISLFGIKFYKTSIEKKQIAKSLENNILKMDKEKIKTGKEKYKEVKNKVKKAKIKLEKLNLYLEIGVEDCAVTAYLVGILYAVISNLLRYLYEPKQNLNNYKYKVIPRYNKNFSKFNLNCILSAKLVHIIYIIFLIKKGSKKNERTSNRKPYEYSYE